MNIQQLQNKRYYGRSGFMNIKITGKDLKATEAIKEYVEKSVKDYKNIQKMNQILKQQLELKETHKLPKFLQI